MTQADIIRMAREAATPQWWLSDDALERFAAIVEQHLIASGYRKCAEGQRTTQFCGQLEAAVLAENEACASAVRFADNGTEAAEIIRARRKK